MLAKLKLALAHHPLACFLAVVVATYVVSAGYNLARSPWPTRVLWLNDVNDQMAIAAGLAALACCWAISGAPTRPRRLLEQIVIVVAVALLVMAMLAMSQWLDMHAVSFHESLGGAFHLVLTSTIDWLVALVAGLVLAGVASPFADIRRLSGALVAWRGGRTWMLIAVALLVPAACVAAARVGVRVVPSEIAHFMIHYSLPYTVGTFLALLLWNVPLVFAWYGFVAERLAGRLSPLVVALLVGCAFTLPLVLATRIIDARYGLADFFSSLTSYSAAEGLGILGSIAVAIPGVWLARKARGSLLPTAVLLCATRVGVFVAIWASPTGASYTRIQEVYDAAVIVAAVLVAVGGRMWRRPETTSLPALASPPALHEPSPAPGDYEVVVHHVSWPG